MTTRRELIECIQALSRTEGTRQPAADDWLRDQGETPKETLGAEAQHQAGQGVDGVSPSAASSSAAKFAK